MLRVLLVLFVFFVSIRSVAAAEYVKGDDFKVIVGKNKKPIKHYKPSYPAVKKQAEKTWLDGKCGQAAMANILMFYGVDKTPEELDKSEYRSVGPGIRRDKMGENLTKLSSKPFRSLNLEKKDAFKILKGYIKAKKPVALLFMMDSLNAHWIVVVDVIGDDPKTAKVVAMNWDNYETIAWSILGDAWRRGYGGEYPHVVCDESSAIMK